MVVLLLFLNQRLQAPELLIALLPLLDTLGQLLFNLLQGILLQLEIQLQLADALASRLQLLFQVCYLFLRTLELVLLLGHLIKQLHFFTLNLVELGEVVGGSRAAARLVLVCLGHGLHKLVLLLLQFAEALLLLSALLLQLLDLLAHLSDLLVVLLALRLRATFFCQRHLQAVIALADLTIQFFRLRAKGGDLVQQVGLILLVLLDDFLHQGLLVLLVLLSVALIVCLRILLG